MGNVIQNITDSSHLDFCVMDTLVINNSDGIRTYFDSEVAADDNFLYMKQEFDGSVIAFRLRDVEYVSKNPEVKAIDPVYFADIPF